MEKNNTGLIISGALLIFAALCKSGVLGDGMVDFGKDLLLLAGGSQLPTPFLFRKS